MSVIYDDLNGFPVVSAYWVYSLLQGQREYFSHRTMSQLTWCKAREKEFFHAFEEYQSHSLQLSLFDDEEGVMNDE